MTKFHILFVHSKNFALSVKSLLHRLVALRQEWFVFSEKQILPKGNGVAWNLMNH